MFIKAGSIGLVAPGRKGLQGELVKRLWMFSEQPKSFAGRNPAIIPANADGAGDALRRGAQPVAAVCGRGPLCQRSAASERGGGGGRQGRRGGALSVRAALGLGGDARS